MKNYTKTKIFTLALCLIVIIITILIQLNGQKLVVEKCSYLDPVIIDILAFLVGIFLIFEGIYRLNEHKNMLIKNQFTRAVRIAIGCAIVTIHFIQYIHK